MKYSCAVVLSIAFAVSGSCGGGADVTRVRRSNPAMVASSGLSIWFLSADGRLGRIVYDPAMPLVEADESGAAPDVEYIAEGRVAQFALSGVDALYASERMVCLRRGQQMLCGEEQRHIDGAPVIFTRSFEAVRSVRACDAAVCVDHRSGVECISVLERGDSARCEEPHEWGSGAYSCVEVGEELACQRASACDEVRVAGWTVRHEMVTGPVDFCVVDTRGRVAVCYMWGRSPNAPLTEYCGNPHAGCMLRTSPCTDELVVTREIHGAESIAATPSVLCAIVHGSLACWRWGDARDSVEEVEVEVDDDEDPTGVEL